MVIIRLIWVIATRKGRMNEKTSKGLEQRAPATTFPHSPVKSITIEEAYGRKTAILTFFTNVLGLNMRWKDTVAKSTTGSK